MSVNMGQAVGYLDLDTSKFKSGFKSALNDLKVFQSETATSKDKLAAFSSAATSAGRSLTKGLTVPIAGMGAAAVAVTARFDAGMSKVQAISGATGKEMEQLRDKAKEMGAQTKFSASESAEAFNYMAMAGWKTQDMLDGIEGVMNLAAASGEDLATTSDIVTDALTAFGLSAKDSTHFADVLAAASSNANTNVGMMGETFKYVAPVAGALGFSVEDVSTAIGLMANSGIKGSQAGTALRNIFTRLVKPTGDSAKVMEQLGISVTDSSGQMKDFNTIMGDLRKGFAGLSEAEKAQAASALAGQYGMSGLLAIVNTSEQDFNKLTDAINNADGASAQMAETMMDNLPGALTLFKSALEGLGIRVGEVMTPTITGIVKAFTNFVAWLTNASDRTIKFAVAMGTVLASLGPVLLIVGTMTRQVLTLVEAYQALNKVLAGRTIASILKSAAVKLKDVIATNLDTAANLRYQASLRGTFSPITTMISRILALAAAHKVATAAALGIVGAMAGLAIYMYQTGSSFEDVKNKATDMFNSVVAKLPELISGITEVASGIVQQIPAIITGIMSSLGAIGGTVLNAIGGLVQQIPSVLSGVFTQLGSLIVSGLSTLRDVLPQVAKWWANDMPQMIAVGSDMIVNVINGVGEALPELINTGSDMLVQFIDQFFAQLPQLIDSGMQIVLTLLDGFLQAFPQFIQGLVTALPELVSAIVNTLSSNIGPLLTAAVNVLTMIVQAIVANLPIILQAVTTIFMALVQAFIQNLPMILNALVTIITALVTAIANSAPQIIMAALKLMLALAQGIIQALPQIVLAAAKIALALVKAILAIAGAMVQAGVKILQALWQGISSGVGSLVGKVRGIGSRIKAAIKGGIGNLLSIGRQWIQSLWNGIKAKVSGLVSSARSAARRFPQAVKGALGSLFSAGANFIQGLWNGIKSKIGGVISGLKSKLSEAASLAKKIFKLGSPSRLMFQYGVWFMEGLENGIDKAYRPLLRDLKSHLNEIVSVYNPLTNYDFGVGESVEHKILGALGGISTGMGELPASGNTITQNISIDGVDNPAETAEQLAKELKIAMRTV